MSGQKPATQNTQTRRSFLKIGVVASISPVINAGCSKRSNANSNNTNNNTNSNTSQLSTPRQTEGPFYPVNQQADKDVDLTIIEGRAERAKGEVIHVRGRVFDTSGVVINNAFVEIWQANTFGRYRHPKDPSVQPLDPNFQGWGQTYTDDKGYYGFKTILPGAYPAGYDWTRPPHIHFKAAAKQHHPLTTQMYFPGHKLNEVDKILQHLSEAEQQMVIAKQQGDDNGAPVFVFDIVLRQAG